MSVARRLFAEDGYYCAEAVVKATAMRLGIDDRLATRLATGFCSGEGRTAGQCGALSGGILALSLALAPDDPRADRERTYAAVQELRERFEKEFGATTCPGLLDGCHLGTPEGQKRFAAENMAERCAGYAAGAAGIVSEILDEGF
ncbi:MAG: C-GCAxxG-C-C family protein [Hyphomicrobiales bacterium]